MSSLKDKVAIVTGASRGIGRSIAERLAQEGAAVVVNYCKSADKAQEVVRGIEKQGGHALAIQADVGKVSDIQRLFQQIIGHYGRIDIVVANAGMFNPKSVVDTTEEEIANATSTNDRFFLPLPGPQSLRYSGMAGATKKYECPLSCPLQEWCEPSPINRNRNFLGQTDE